MSIESDSGARGDKPVNVSAYQVGQIVHAVSAKYETKKTAPPERYSQDTLLDDMLAAHKFAKSVQDRDILRSVEGLGTSRTRQPMVDGAIRRGFFISTKKGKRHVLESSQMAKVMMASFQPELKDVAQTAKWELAFSMIERGDVNLAQVVDRAYIFVHAVVAYAKEQRGKIKFQSPSASASGAGRRA